MSRYKFGNCVWSLVSLVVRKTAQIKHFAAECTHGSFAGLRKRYIDFLETTFDSFFHVVGDLTTAPPPLEQQERNVFGGGLDLDPFLERRSILSRCIESNFGVVTIIVA